MFSKYESIDGITLLSRNMLGKSVNSIPLLMNGILMESLMLHGIISHVFNIQKRKKHQNPKKISFMGNIIIKSAWKRGLLTFKPFKFVRSLSIFLLLLFLVESDFCIIFSTG